MKHVLLLSSLLFADASAQRNISCKIPAVQAMEATSLTCTFPVDISLSKQDFSVIHSNRTSKAVLDCLWEQGSLECFNATGYEFNKTVTNQMTIWIPHVLPNMTGDYYCKVSDSTGYNIQHCQLELKPETINNKANESFERDSVYWTIGVLIPLIVSLVVIIVVFSLRRNRCLVREQERNLRECEEGLLLRILSTGEKQREQNEDSLPRTFEEYLKRAVNRLYPNMLESHYFVPPIYFNRTRYKKQFIAGKDVYVPDTTDPHDMQHDGAMQHVLYCLQHLAEQQQEQMFVLTQFKYEDYLRSPVPGYAHNSLPMPLVSTEEENNVSCFDLLVVHKRHGVLVGVVKSVSEKDIQKKRNQEEMETNVVLQVSEALKQLEKADKMIKYIMADERLKVKHTLILPNLSSSLLGNVLKDPGLVQELRDRLGVAPNKDPAEMCLCADNLSDSNTPWNVSPAVVKNIQQRWGWTTEGDNITPEQYASIIVRFFGPAILSTLQVPDDYIKFELPKTLAEAVSLTGELYEWSMLHPDFITQLDERRACLVGSPNTGKTRMLSFVGGKWLSEGHDVFIVKDTSFQTDPLLSNHLKSLLENGQTGSSAEASYGRVYEEMCNLQSNESIEECIQKIIKDKDDARICILLDVAHLKGTHIKTFCKILEKAVSDSNLYLWISCTGDECPPKGYCKLFTEIVNCPPAVVRELAKVQTDTRKQQTKRTAVVCPPPTDGPPVKYFTIEPKDSVKCGRDVGRFLAKELLIGRADDSQSVYMQMPIAKYRDVLLLFENEDEKFLEGLMEWDIPVQVAQMQDKIVVFDQNIDSALAMNVGHMESCRMKRRIVVYIENNKSQGFSDRKNKQRALTSCTSQLILVHKDKK